MGFQDVALLPSRASSYPMSSKRLARIALQSPRCLWTVGGGKEGHVNCKMVFLLL